MALVWLSSILTSFIAQYPFERQYRAFDLERPPGPTGRFSYQSGEINRRRLTIPKRAAMLENCQIRWKEEAERFVHQ
jgi:hypothetical protein